MATGCPTAGRGPPRAACAMSTTSNRAERGNSASRAPADWSVKASTGQQSALTIAALACSSGDNVVDNRSMEVRIAAAPTA